MLRSTTVILLRARTSSSRLLKSLERYFGNEICGMKDRSFMDIVHYPVMQKEVLEYLKPASPDGLRADATLGEGGHSELLLKTYPSLSVVGVDADPSTIRRIWERLLPLRRTCEVF